VGDRRQPLRYFSAERYDWEEVPAGLVDWPATDKYNKERDSQRNETIKEMEKEDAADDLDAPAVATGIRLPNTGGVLLLMSSRAIRNWWSWCKTGESLTNTRVEISCVRRLTLWHCHPRRPLNCRASMRAYSRTSDDRKFF